MQINTQTQTSLKAADTSTTGSADKATGLSSDFETFLKMLTVQMQNQDPLNPVDSADFAVQLASFSSVEQQVKTNELLESLSSKFGSDNLGGLAQWIGLDVRAGSEADYRGAKVELFVPENARADRRMLVVHDNRGEVVYRKDIALDGSNFFWDGTVSNGSQAPQGNYAFHVEFLEKGELLETGKVQTYGTVAEARIEKGVTQLILRNGSMVSADTISAVRSSETR